MAHSQVDFFIYPSDKIKVKPVESVDYPGYYVLEIGRDNIFFRGEDTLRKLRDEISKTLEDYGRIKMEENDA